MKREAGKRVRNHQFAGLKQLTLRSIVIGALGASIITASSMYVALRMSALPWPTIFVAVLSMALLKALGGTNLNEINIAQTAMSAGAMVAGGMAFTLPGLWITGIWGGPNVLRDHLWQVVLIALAGMVLGTVLTWLLRPKYIEGDRLTYPIGIAAAQTLKAGDEGGRKSIVLFGALGFSAPFTYLRDSLGWIPDFLYSQRLYAQNLFIGIWVSPMAAGIGYMIGTLYTGIWFLGAFLSYVLIIPLGTLWGIFPSPQDATQFVNLVGIGLMVGTGVGIILTFVLALYQKNSGNGDARGKNQPKTGPITGGHRFFIILPVVLSFVFTVVAGISPLPSLLLIAGVFAATTMAATITGQTGINPMEVFGIIVLLAIRLIASIDDTGAFFIAACVAIACGYGGDILNDYKAGHLLQTNPAAQMAAQFVGGIVGAVVASVAMIAIIGQFGGVGPEIGLPAAQAYAVSQMVHGIGSPWVFGTAMIVGAVLYMLKLPSMTLGIGMYLPFGISSIVFIGGMIRLITDRLRPKSVNTGNVAASGLLGGEGITGVAVAIIRMITGA